MKVRSAREAGAADKADDIAAFYSLATRNIKSGEMCIARFVAKTVVNEDHISKTSRKVCGLDHAIAGCIHGCASIRGEIQPLVIPDVSQEWV